jgi:hypothetical protein
VEGDYDELMKSGALKESHKDKPRKLTQLLSTMNEFTTFYSYFLWFLIDLGFVVDEVNEMDVFQPMM